MSATRARLAPMLAVATLALSAPSLTMQPGAGQAFAASEIAAVVNRTAITSTDVARRVAFMRLRGQKPDRQKAREELVEETLKRQEVARLRMSVSTGDVDQAFARFAQSNRMTVQQITGILNQAGVTAQHFKDFIAVQMSWPRVVNARYGNRGRMSSQDLVTRMLQNKQKPVTTEYVLQQVIFVVPEARRNAVLNKRKAEAEAARPRFPGCDQAKTFAATMLDVSVRNLGRLLSQELPDDWKPLVEKASGGTTATRVTDKGVEFLAICRQRQVSDDYAAEMVFQAEDLAKEEKDGANPNEKKYLDDLRSKAQVEFR